MLQLKAEGHLLGFQPKKVYFASLDHVLSVEFLGTPGAMPKTAARGREKGRESKVPSLGRVVYEELWEGISLTYEAREGGIAESTYQIGPWADVSKIRLGYNVPVEAEKDGSLKFKFDRGYLTESPPEAWQEIGGERVPVAVAFRVKRGEVGFSVGSYDPSYPLTIDPTYAWHTFYGSGDSEEGDGIATDGSGNVYVTGVGSATWNGPTGQSPLHAHSGSNDIFVLKLDSSGAYQWHTFYGSGNSEEGNSIATDGSGNVYVTGVGGATWNGPTGQTPLHAHSGSNDIFVLKLASTGAYQWHTFYGSSDGDIGDGIATDGSGNAYVTGYSFGTWNGPAGQTPLHAHTGAYNICVLKLDSSGAYQWHTFYGSSGGDIGYGIATDGSGNAYVTGTSYETWNGPTGQTPLHTPSGGSEIFVLKLDSSGAYQWHTFYGSSDDDYPFAIATDGSGNVYLTGESLAAWNGPAGQSPLHVYSGSYDIFVLKLDSSGSYQWHTFYGSSDSDAGYGIATDGSGNVYVTGTSYETWNGPAEQSPLHTHSGVNDIFVLKLASTGAYRWHTFYGSSSDEAGYGVAVDRSGNVSVTGISYTNWNGPTGQSPRHAHSGGSDDILVLKLSDPPVGCDFDRDGDGKADVAVYHSASGLWFIKPSSGAPDYYVGYGATGYDPVLGDFDGDGKKDIAVYHSASGLWFIKPSSDATDYYIGYGGTGYVPVPGDYDGDGKTDVAIYHQASGLWYVKKSSDGYSFNVTYGGSGFDPVLGDFDGDGKTDFAVYHQASGFWYIMKSSDYGSYNVNYGGTGYVPVPGDYDGDGKTDVAVYHSASGLWFIKPSSGAADYNVGYGGSGYAPIPGDYDGDGETDIAVYHSASGLWFIKPSSGATGYYVGYGGAGYTPVNLDYLHGFVY
jgi:hypothetical protein